MKDSPDNPYEYLATLKAERYAEQGTSFDYGSVNTDILGWMVEKVTGMPFTDALSNEIWMRAGMEADASFVAPRFGVPHWDGGFLPRMRDLARFGMLYTPSYRAISDKRIISEEACRDADERRTPGALAKRALARAGSNIRTKRIT